MFDHIEVIRTSQTLDVEFRHAFRLLALGIGICVSARNPLDVAEAPHARKLLFDVQCLHQIAEFVAGHPIAGCVGCADTGEPEYRKLQPAAYFSLHPVHRPVEPNLTCHLNITLLPPHTHNRQYQTE